MTVRQAIALKANQLSGVAVCSLICAAGAVYRWHHGSWPQSIALGMLTVGLWVLAYRNVRDYAKGKENQPLRRVGIETPSRPYATYALVSLCVLATCLGWILPHQWYIYEGTIGAAEVLQRHEYYRFVTSAFLHASWMHLYFNMLVLWVVGRDVEERLGTIRFCVVYALSALGGGVSVVLSGQELTLGSSGAIFGLFAAELGLAAFAWKNGNRAQASASMRPLAIVVGATLLFSVLLPHISLAAHLGGLLFGAIALLLVGVPRGLKEAWTAARSLDFPVEFLYNATNGIFSFKGSAARALEAGIVTMDDAAITVGRNQEWPKTLFVSEIDRDKTPIICELSNLSVCAVRFALESYSPVAQVE